MQSSWLQQLNRKEKKTICFSWIRNSKNERCEHVIVQQVVLLFISYLLGFLDRIDCVKNSCRNFIQSQSQKHFLTRRKSVSSNQKSAVKMNQSVRITFTLLLVPPRSSFTELGRVSTRLLQFCRKLAINHRQWRKVFIALVKPIKNYIQEKQNKKTRAKTRLDVKVCLRSKLVIR